MCPCVCSSYAWFQKDKINIGNSTSVQCHSGQCQARSRVPYSEVKGVQNCSVSLVLMDPGLKGVMSRSSVDTLSELCSPFLKGGNYAFIVTVKTSEDTFGHGITSLTDTFIPGLVLHPEVCNSIAHYT